MSFIDFKLSQSSQKKEANLIIQYWHCICATDDKWILSRKENPPRGSRKVIFEHQHLPKDDPQIC